MFTRRLRLVLQHSSHPTNCTQSFGKKYGQGIWPCKLPSIYFWNGKQFWQECVQGLLAVHTHTSSSLTVRYTFCVLFLVSYSAKFLENVSGTTLVVLVGHVCSALFWGQVYHQGTVDISERKIWIWNGKPGSGGSYLPDIIFVEWCWNIYSGKGCAAVLAASPPIWCQVVAPFTGDWRNCATWVVWWQCESEINLSRSWKNGGHLFELSVV